MIEAVSDQWRGFNQNHPHGLNHTPEAVDETPYTVGDLVILLRPCGVNEFQ